MPIDAQNVRDELGALGVLRQPIWHTARQDLQVPPAAGVQSESKTLRTCVRHMEGGVPVCTLNALVKFARSI